MAVSKGMGREGVKEKKVTLTSIFTALLALSSLAAPCTLSHQICALLCEPAQRRDILQSNLLHFHLPERGIEGGGR